MEDIAGILNLTFQNIESVTGRGEEVGRLDIFKGTGDEFMHEQAPGLGLVARVSVLFPSQFQAIRELLHVVDNAGESTTLQGMLKKARVPVSKATRLRGAGSGGKSGSMVFSAPPHFRIKNVPRSEFESLDHEFVTSYLDHLSTNQPSATNPSLGTAIDKIVAAFHIYIGSLVTLRLVVVEQASTLGIRHTICRSHMLWSLSKHGTAPQVVMPDGVRSLQTYDLKGSNINRDAKVENFGSDATSNPVWLDNDLAKHLQYVQRARTRQATTRYTPFHSPVSLPLISS